MSVHGVGVIGLGMGEVHMQACRRYPNVEVRAVCDTDAARLESVASAHGVGFATTDYQELASRADVDLVIVASPDFYHAVHAVAAMERGKHVLCEKPLALTMADCETIIEAADRTGATCMVGQVCRFAPGFVRAKELVDAGAVGKLFLVESEYAHNYAGVPGAGNWRRDPDRPRHPVIGGGCHAVDLVRWVAGDVSEVAAYSNHFALTDWPTDDCTVAALRFESGAVGRLMVSIGCKRDYTMRSTFYGTKGTIIADNTSDAITVYTELPELAVDDVPQGHSYTSPLRVAVGQQEKAVAEEVGHFLEVVEGRRPLEMDAREGARTVATCLAIVASAERGMPARVQPVV